MLAQSRMLRVRLPRCRRPRERSWEVLNTRNLGHNEGSQNLRMIALLTAASSAIFGYEGYSQFQRIKARGDTCAACEAARETYRQRIREKEEALRASM